MPENLKAKVSRMYFLSDISKTDIGKHLGISRFRVSRLIEQAREEGIVRIQIVDPSATFSELEEQLERRFKLHHAIVVHPGDQSEVMILKAIANAAAWRLVNLLTEGDVLGITWGATVNEVVKAMPLKVNLKLQVVQITGGLNQSAIDINPMDLVRRVAEKCDARSYFLYAPAFVSNSAVREALLKDGGFNETIGMFDKVTVALSGIGAFSSMGVSGLLKSNYLDKADTARLRKRKAVGDIFGHFFDIEGRICDPELEQRIIGMGIEQLKKIRYSIGVAGGKYKSMAILGALRGNFINVLITDQLTAYDILEKDTLLFG